jgi:hypothetical protein
MARLDRFAKEVAQIGADPTAPYISGPVILLLRRAVSMLPKSVDGGNFGLSGSYRANAG